MDTEKCRVLLGVLETGSLSAAAEKLGYTPSGISRMMASLESETGFPLLFRGHGGVTATPECQKLLPAVRELAFWNEQYLEKSAEVRGLQTGSITVGTAYSVHYRWLAGLVAQFCNAYPNIAVNIIEGRSTALSRAVEEKRADFCIISSRGGKYDWIPLKRDELMAWVPMSHPLAKGAGVPVSAFAHEPFIEIFPGQETDNTRIFEENGIKPNSRFSSSDTYAAYSMVDAGLGISMANSLETKELGGNVAVLPLIPAQFVDIGVAVSDAQTLSPAAKRFLKFAKEHFSEL